MDAVDWGAYYSFPALRSGWPGATIVMQVVSFLGSYLLLGLVLLGAVAALGQKRHYRTALLLATLMVGSAVLVELLKLAISRHRPPAWDGRQGSALAFPSAEAFLSVELYGALAWLVAKNLAGWVKLTLVYCIATVLVLVIGASQLYLGASFVSDVLAGWAGGLALLLAWTNLVPAAIANPATIVTPG